MIIIDTIALVDMMLAIDLCPVEISGLGEVEVRGDHKKITEIFVPFQQCAPDGTEFDPYAYNIYCAALIREKGRAAIRTKRLWWHSHVHMTASFSDIDYEYILRTFGENVMPHANPWLISIVGNKLHSFTMRYDEFLPERRASEQKIELGAFVPRELVEIYTERTPRMEALVRERVKIVERPPWKEVRYADPSDP